MLKASSGQQAPDSPQSAQEILGPVWLTEFFVSVAVPGGSLGPPRWPSGLLQLRTPVSACGQEHTGQVRPYFLPTLRGERPSVGLIVE